MHINQTFRSRLWYSAFVCVCTNLINDTSLIYLLFVMLFSLEIKLLLLYIVFKRFPPIFIWKSQEMKTKPTS